ncbi:TolB family protein [Teredinibacter haidensis]|uniref:TolB family protein n=1 Tax=Teredinibacter haidensis TaxID=2731755 RepID=UPI000948A34A|nr:TolB family protein [Teredinibacter haidensis]
MPQDLSVESQLELLQVATGERRVIYRAEVVFEAPNWHPADGFLVFNQQGRLYRFDLSGTKAELINSEFAGRCNNDHGISPDGKHIVISHHAEDSEGQSVIYILPIDGGEPRRVTERYPSYWHGWSPDGKTLAYVAGRPISTDYDIYSIAVEGGEETRLTSTSGLDDGPDYSTDGQHIYYNSYQSGMMQVWRMDADGSNPKQMVQSPHSDWFPHPSPDGKKLVFIRYLDDQQQDHPFGRDVKLVLLDLQTGEERDLTEVFYGGQGSLNVPSWSPDSRQLAFVSYRKM